MLRRSSDIKDSATYFDQVAEIRTKFFGRLKDELMKSCEGMLDEAILTEFVDKRNWFVHHLCLDPRYVQSTSVGGFDLSGEISFFSEKLSYFKQIYESIAGKRGVIALAEEMTRKGADTAPFVAAVNDGIRKLKSRRP